MHPELIPGFVLGIFFARKVVLTTPRQTPLQREAG
jgi:hypothetical protein